jgi:mannitol-specific phosphotransferase system IIBC component
MSNNSIPAADVKKICLACEAGAGSSVIVKNGLIKKLKKAGLEIEVIHSPVIHIAEQEADIYVCHQGLADTAQSLKPDSVVIRFMMFMNDPVINKMVDDLKNGNEIVST